MHNVALDLKAAGHEITGSDDAIFEPSRTRLEHAGILPEQMGWHESNIHPGLDLVILGMHARADNPELIRAQQLGLPIQSFPEYIADASKDKKRLVIAGSHGKTSTTAMVMHVFNQLGISSDYLVGSQLQGFDTMVKVSDAPIMVIEGDEYLSSPMDLRSKFLHYRPHVAIITGIAWDHINVFPTWESYIETFRKFIASIMPSGTLIYYSGDAVLVELVKEAAGKLKLIPYQLPPHRVEHGITKLCPEGSEEIALQIFGPHNLENLEAALKMANEVGVSVEQYYQAIKDFSGAARRLETIFNHPDLRVIKDFAHAPSKVKASMNAVRTQFPNHQIMACFEPHTFSSLSPEFMKNYAGSLNEADTAVVFMDKQAFELKQKEMPEEQLVQEAFNCPGLEIVRNPNELLKLIQAKIKKPAVILMMSSGSWGGMDLNTIGESLN